jgi:redox-sensitive bicupin YhaK (pirin superfamily)
MVNQVNMVIEPRMKDLGGLIVNRVIPWVKKRMVGPFIFLDHMGPVHFEKDHNINVNAHPHIGLSTLTYLFKGRIHHKDSLGSSLVIVPGEVNWMTAGSGISHSEKAAKEDIGLESDLHGLQFWVALPDHLEEMEPSFFNFKKQEIPKIETDDVEIDVVVGELAGKTSPVKCYSPVAFFNIKAKNHYNFRYDSETFEVALYLIEGAIEIDDKTYSNHEMIVFEEGSKINVKINKGTHCVLIGGEKFPNPKFIFWNFVSSSKERIDKARNDWNSGNFPQVPGEVEKIISPLDKI